MKLEVLPIIGRRSLILDIDNTDIDGIRRFCENGTIKRQNIKYCKKCGSENSIKNEHCFGCNTKTFLNEYTSSVIGGYIQLLHKGSFTKYYDKIMNRHNKSIKMNDKRMITALLIHKERILDVDDDTVSKIYRVNK